MMFFIGLLIGLVLISIGWPLSAYPLIISQAAVSQRRSSLLLAIGLGLMMDIGTFQAWPKLVTVYIFTTIFIDWLFNKILIKQPLMAVIITLLIYSLIIATYYYLTDQLPNLFNLGWLLIVNLTIGLIWINIIKFWSYGRSIQPLSPDRSTGNF